MKLILLIATTMLLSACQSNPNQVAPVVPQPAAPSPLELVDRVNDASAKRFDTVEQRITLMQEKLIELNLQLQRASRQDQLQLATLQQLQQSSEQQAQAQTQAVSNTSGPTTLDQLTELVFRLEQMSAEAQSLETETSSAATRAPNYRLVSVYGPKGWVVLKYDASTGTSWKAEAGDWALIDEVGVLPESNYQVVMQLAPGDVKGYVAARIDSGNGITWWLKDNQWEPF